jgi:hypothetical protein
VEQSVREYLLLAGVAPCLRDAAIVDPQTDSGRQPVPESLRVEASDLFPDLFLRPTRVRHQRTARERPVAQQSPGDLPGLNHPFDAEIRDQCQPLLAIGKQSPHHRRRAFDQRLQRP